MSYVLSIYPMIPLIYNYFVSSKRKLVNGEKKFREEKCLKVRLLERKFVGFEQQNVRVCAITFEPFSSNKAYSLCYILK